jgi:hypothetical protein
MQGTVVMLLALSGLGCHHKSVVTTGYVETCYSSGCYSSCYSGSSCYSSCYSSGYSSCYSSCYSGAAYSPADYSCYSCYSSCYSSKRHKHGLFGCKKKTCGACAPVETVYEAPICDPCGGMSYGSYTPVSAAYPTGQMGYTSSQLAPVAKPVMTETAAPSAPDAPSPGNPTPVVAPPVTPPTPAPATATPPVVPPTPAPATTPPATPPPPGV